MPRRKKSRFIHPLIRGRLRIASKSFLIRPANNQCQVCGYNHYIGNLSFHHKNPKDKLFNISMMLIEYKLPKLIAEASKCILVCHNCHGEIHANLIEHSIIEAIKPLNYTRYKIPSNVIKWYMRKCKKDKKSKSKDCGS